MDDERGGSWVQPPFWIRGSRRGIYGVAVQSVAICTGPLPLSGRTNDAAQVNLFSYCFSWLFKFHLPVVWTLSQISFEIFTRNHWILNSLYTRVKFQNKQKSSQCKHLPSSIQLLFPGFRLCKINNKSTQSSCGRKNQQEHFIQIRKSLHKSWLCNQWYITSSTRNNFTFANIS